MPFQPSVPPSSLLSAYLSISLVPRTLGPRACQNALPTWFPWRLCRRSSRKSPLGRISSFTLLSPCFLRVIPMELPVKRFCFTNGELSMRCTGLVLIIISSKLFEHQCRQFPSTSQRVFIPYSDGSPQLWRNINRLKGSRKGVCLLIILSSFAWPNR